MVHFRLFAIFAVTLVLQFGISIGLINYKGFKGGKKPKGITRMCVEAFTPSDKGGACKPMNDKTYSCQGPCQTTEDTPHSAAQLNGCDPQNNTLRRCARYDRTGVAGSLLCYNNAGKNKIRTTACSSMVWAIQCENCN
ncbi:hypothetical protein CROQUDRAFT_87265 [Cronartium quercuum f. sp. fusiforme G11]|uniref:Uncharacterized protein n=1 Tax=Cronartium quercuum f. sp. fusiforme G11 TaxID=708437 RepID=A0A9P6TG63_9BASI|nr:hypothetical protein CROQUDRAFT_87265 [Cronartium quercuum f. sp. fusiforme G11]